ncbi:flagellar hook-basal body complex protein FliE [Pararhizobium haloflavum]|uniref:flagellar hook-basal body complex protein FliE n=1 Tax=Pararhizobium haloflavum TaxID=2037914 RepID=UPI000C185AA0|nr:flagellar hook-basal body complex protein FliE [Pararhizobium haloflavum]
MTGPVQNVSALSFTRQLDGVQQSASSSSSNITNLPGAAGSAAAEPGDFQMTLASIAGDMAANLRTAEQVSLQGINGEAETREVVDAVMSAEQTLQTAIAIRDKIVTAYLEISRMQI